MGRKIVFTGGGSAGHVTPNIALMRKLREDGWTIEYIGSEEGIERAMIEELGDIPYHPIATGKLRRYFDINNFKDPLRVVKGISQSYSLLKRIRPDIVFSKGGFVSVPVIIGSRLNGIPAIIHESDMTPGLANKISIPLATKVCCTFRETLRYLPKGKAVHTGTPIREELLAGDSRRGMKLLGFHSQKPVVTVMGGSLGAQAINRAVRESLPELLKRFQLIHICGKDNVDRSLEGTAGYRQFEFVGETLPDLLAATDLAVSRAGANAIFEFLALRIPMLLIPLSRQASRGDQLLNAESFRQAGYCRVLYEEDLSAASLIEQLTRLQEEAEPIAARMRQASESAGSEAILQLIRSVSSGA